MGVRHLLRIAALSICASALAAAQARADPEYFDAYDHFTGVLPYYAYANLPAFVVEHSDIAKEYRYASALIAYWSQTDSHFRAMAPAVSERTLFDDVRRHLTDMASDRRLPYEGGGG